MPYTPPNGTLAASWAGAGEYAPPKTILWGSWPADVRITPVGMRAPVLPNPTATIQQFAAPQGWFSGAAPASPLVTYDWQYRPPFLSVHAAWAGTISYAPPAPTVNAVWARGGTTPDQFVFVDGFDAAELGEPSAIWPQYVLPDGWTSGRMGAATVRPPPLNAFWQGAGAYAPAQGVLWGRWAPLSSASGLHIYPNPEAPPAVGAPHLVYPRALAPSGLDAAEVSGGTHIINVSRQIWAGGFDAASVPRPLIWNWRQYAPMLGWVAQQFGAAYIQGGVKTVDLGGRGLAAALHGSTSVINTTANQSARPVGVAPVPLASPGVSPRTLWPLSIYGTVSGFPVVQFPPQPRGWQSSAFGYPSIRDKAHYARGEGFDAYVTGYAVVRDRAQKVLHQAAVVTSVFGDVVARLQNARVRPAGLDALETSSFAEVRSNRRYLQAAGVPTPAAGAADVRNKTPSLAPPGWSSAFFGPQHIGWRVRRINAVGVAAPLAQVALPSLWQTPGLRPAGIPAPAVAPPVVGLGRRTVSTAGRDALLHGAPIVGFRYRVVLLEGEAKDSALYGAARLEHGMRTLLALGALRDGYGTPWVSRSPRAIEPQGVPQPVDRSTPMVGGRRWLFPDGFDAARFGTRIVPERQSLYPLGFTGGYGLAQVLNVRRYLRPAGITTYQQPQDHWGRAAVWNSRQYVSMAYDPDSGLNSPAWPQWTAVSNRDRSIGATGTAMARMGAPFVENGARALLPAGFAQPAFAGALLVADRIRPLFMDGLEPPYIARWTTITNNAAVLRATGTVATLFGQASLESNRRILTRIGGMDVFAPGSAFIAPRVRGIELIQRYAIAPPYLPLPVVQLSTRYVEVPPGIEPKEAGRAALQIVWRGLIPRWTHRDYFGEPRLHNVTPELQGRGWVAEEFGNTAVRLQWRPVAAVQDNTSDLFGRTRIADKRQHITPMGSDYLRFGDKLKVERFGVQPPSLQTITVENVGNGEFINLSTQVSKPVLNQQVIYPTSGAAQTKWGSALVQSNGIRVEPGYWELLVGEPVVMLGVRRVTVGPFPPGEIFDPSAPRLSPHTIYAVMDAPGQAKLNHPAVRLHYVDSSGGDRPPGVVFGRAVVTLRHRTVRPSGYAPPPFGIATIFNRRQHIATSGHLSLRFGWPVVPGPQNIVVEQEKSHEVYGRPLVAPPPYIGPQTVRPSGLLATAFAKSGVSHRHRKVAAAGLVSLAMGASRGDRPYAWQSLHVGPPMPTMPEGFAPEAFGEAWISPRVRGIEAEGFDAFASEYDYTAFAQRMRVRNAQDGTPPRRFVQQQGHASSCVGTPSTRMGTHYIRPDGNSDQHRKGVTQ